MEQRKAAPKMYAPGGSMKTQVAWLPALGSAMLAAAEIALAQVLPSHIPPPPPGILPGMAELMQFTPRDGKRRIVSTSDIKDPAARQELLDKIKRDRDVRLGAKVIREASAERVRYLKHRAARVRPYEEIKSSTAIKLFAIEESMDGARLLGYIPSGTRPGQPTTRMGRVLQLSHDRLVEIMEWDYIADGGGLLEIREMCDQPIGDECGTLVVSIAPSGESMWTLQWSTPEKSVMLDLYSPKFSESDRDWLLRFARSLKNPLP